MQANKTADNQYLIPLMDGIIENIDIADGILLTTSEFVSQEDIEMTTTHDDLSLFQISFCIDGNMEWSYINNEVVHQFQIAAQQSQVRYTSINLNNKASHNTLIQLVYQFGLIGIPFLVSWVVISLRNLFAQFNVGRVQWKHVLLVCVGVALPWMGIDILQFDEFFLLPIYAVIGIAYSTNSTENT